MTFVCTFISGLKAPHHLSLFYVLIEGEATALFCDLLKSIKIKPVLRASTLKEDPFIDPPTLEGWGRAFRVRVSGP